MCERQLSSDLDSIDKGHVARYRFATSRVEGLVLDAACGCGYGSKMMNDGHAFVIGIDLEEEAIDFAKRHYPGPEYQLGDVTDRHGQFDWVVSFETIEHLKAPELALRHFRESINLIVSTPNAERYPFRPESYAGDRFPHIRHYTDSELESLLNSTGWKVVEKHCQIEKRSEVTSGGGGMFHVWVCR